MAISSDILTMNEAAEYLKVSRQALYDLVRGKKKIPGFKVGGRWRFRKSSLDKWIEKEERRKT